MWFLQQWKQWINIWNIIFIEFIGSNPGFFLLSFCWTGPSRKIVQLRSSHLKQNSPCERLTWELHLTNPPMLQDPNVESSQCWICLLGQWLNFKLFGITYLVGKIEFKLLFQGPLAKWVWRLSKGKLTDFNKGTGSNESAGYSNPPFLLRDWSRKTHLWMNISMMWNKCETIRKGTSTKNESQHGLFTFSEFYDKVCFFLTPFITIVGCH